MDGDRTPAELVVRLDGSGLDHGLVGGKAAALDRLVRLGTRVPVSFALTTAAYREFVSDADLASLLDRLRTTTVDDDPTLDDRAIDDAFLRTRLPERTHDAIVAALRSGSGRPWAIRSSATAEDLDDASFAGQYTSLLNVDEDAVDEAIRRVWASLWHRAPRRYRWFRGIDDRSLDMAVLMMTMLDPDHAGVLFTSDPLGPPDTARIEVVHGLGEALVSGAATPDVVTLERSATPAPPEYPFVDELLAIGDRLEREFDGPQDVEWAVENGALYLLQVRPITTANVDPADVDTTDDGFDDPPRAGVSLTTAGIAEMLPDHLPPRLWSLNRRFVDDGFRSLFELLHADTSDLDEQQVNLVARYRGRAVLDLDALRRVVASIPGGSVDELEHQYLGTPDDGAAPSTSRTPTAAALRQGTRTLRARSAAALEAETVVQIVDALLADERPAAELADDELLAVRSRLLHVAARVGAAEVLVAAIATASYHSVERFLSRHLPAADVKAAAQALTTRPASMAIDSPVASIADVIATDPSGVASSVAVDDDWSEAHARLERTDAGRAFLEAFNQRLRRAGSMAVFGGPTWAEAPSLAWLAAAHAHPDPMPTTTDAADVEARIVNEPSWRYARALQGQMVDVRKHFLRRESAEAAAFLARRESTKAALLRLGGIVRRIDLEIGHRLVAAGRLEDLDDIDLIVTHEIRDLLLGSGPTPASLAHRRRRMAAAERAGPLPRVFEGWPDLAQPQSLDGDVFSGWAASPGWHAGHARVVHAPQDHHLRRGDVLVARNTDASWAPLFLIAGAIIVEQGGPLSHAAIVAREFGVPAIVNVPGIVDRIDADAVAPFVEVDGTAGTITIAAPDASSGPEVLASLVPPRDPPAITEPVASRVGVFVTGLIGASALMSVVFALTESVGGKRARRRFDRRARPIAAMTSQAVTHGFDAAAQSPIGLSSRRTYGWAAVPLALIGGFLIAESTEAYLESTPGGGETLLWAMACITGLHLAALAGLAATAAWRWPNVPNMVRHAAPFTGSAPASTRHRTDTAAVASTVLLSGFVALLIINLWMPTLLQPLDDWLHDAIEASPDNERIGPVWLRWFGQPRVVIPFAIALGIAAYRCRLLAFALPVTIMLAGIVNVTLWWIVGKERPMMGIYAGRADSFPGGHAITVTLLFGLLPLAVHVRFGRRWLTMATRAAATAVMVVLLIDQVRQGGHWTSDQLAGLLLGASGVVAVHGLVGSHSAHYRCRDCPWVRDTGGGP